MRNHKLFYSLISMFMAVLIVVLSVSVPVNAVDNMITTEESDFKTMTKSTDKIDSVLKEKMEQASPDERIAVAIWYEDVDQEQIDTLTAQKVGFSQEEVALDYEMPSTQLLNNLKIDEHDAEEQMKAYLERTESVRTLERKRTAEYIVSRREFSRAKYNEKAENVIDDIEINEENIIFKSQYAPMIVAELTVTEIENLRDSNIVSGLYYDSNDLSLTESEPISETGSNETSVGMIKQVIGYADLITTLSRYDANYMPGENIKIGVAEGEGLIDVTDEEIDSVDIEFVGEVDYTEDDPDHMLGTVKVIAGETDGFLKGAKIFCSNTSYSSIEQLLTEGVQLINISAYVFNISWIEHLVAEHSVTIVAAVGNTNVESKFTSAYIYKPAAGFNVIGVGAYFLSSSSNVTIDKTDDRVATTSAYNEDTTIMNGLVGVEKPDVVMPYIPPNGATSCATPILTSFVAIMYQLKPSLAVYPQAVKAIVLASCHRKVNPSVDNENVETMEQGITERQGAGAPDFFVMLSILSQGTYGVGRISDTATQGIRRFVLPSGDLSNAPTKLNVSISWLREIAVDSGFSHDDGGYLLSETGANLDLYVYRNNQLVGSSKIGTDNDKRSSTEMAYIQLDNSKWDYEIRIQKDEAYNKVVRYGYAYSTDLPYFSYEDDNQGVCYIRNYVSDKYLTLNDNNEIVMENFTGEQNQKWVISGTPGDYEILPAYGEVGTNINYGSQVNSNPYYKAVIGEDELNLSITSWENDTTLEPDAHIFVSKSQTGNNILSYTSSTSVFVRSTTEPIINMYRMWVLEDINFRVGDANLDGKITVQDATEIQKCLDELEGKVFNNLTYYLSDYNYDGVVNIKDVTAIQKFVSDILDK